MNHKIGIFMELKGMMLEGIRPKRHSVSISLLTCMDKHVWTYTTQMLLPFSDRHLMYG